MRLRVKTSRKNKLQKSASVMLFIYSVAKTQLRNAPFGTSPRLAARSLSRTGRFFASASRPRCWVVMQGYEVRTCSAAPRFKTVTASLGHSFVPPTWKLIHSVHMTHEKRAFVLRDKSSFFRVKRVFGTGSGAARREGASQGSICGSVWHASLPIVRSTILHFALCANLHEKTKRACYSRSRRCI